MVLSLTFSELRLVLSARNSHLKVKQKHQATFLRSNKGFRESGYDFHAEILEFSFVAFLILVVLLLVR